MFKKFLIILSSFLMISCASVQTKENQRSYQKFWPKLPETPRYEYLMTIYSSDDFVEKTDTEKMRESLVGKSPPAYVFKRPIDIAVRNGMMYFIDSDKAVVYAVDFARRRFYGFGYRFEGKLASPVSVAVGKDGLVYVADRGRNSIIVYDNFGLYRSVINLQQEAIQIAGIAIDDAGGFLYVVDRGGIDSKLHQLLKYTLDGQLVKKTGIRGDEPLQFNLPLDVSVGSDGSVYVLDSGNFRVQKLSREGEFIESWGKAGDLLGHFGMPRSIAMDEEDNIYISDAQFGNVQIFNNKGKLLMSLGRLSQDDEPGAYSLITGITVDDRSYLYVLDQYMKKMEVFKKMTEADQKAALDNHKKAKP